MSKKVTVYPDPNHRAGSTDVGKPVTYDSGNLPGATDLYVEWGDRQGSPVIIRDQNKVVRVMLSKHAVDSITPEG